VRDVSSELIKVWPDATRCLLSSHEVFRHRDEVPAHKYEALIKPMAGPRLIIVTARDSFDDRLAVFLLDCADEGRLPALGSAKIAVIAAKFPKPWSFECVVVVPPKIAGRFDHQSAQLKRITYWVVPAFAFEFRNGEDGDGFWIQIRRRDGWKVDVMRWDRSRKSEPVWD
jgi:hypothetical protein